MIRKFSLSMRSTILPMIAAGLIAYFGYHAVHGERGILALHRYQIDNDRLLADLDRLKQEKAALEHKLALLRPERLDPDMLDEQARRVLFLSRKDEFVIFESTLTGQ